MKSKVATRLRSLLLLIIFLLPTVSHARTLVLVHGFLSDGNSWKSSGFTKPLLASGWNNGGSFGYAQQGMFVPRGVSLGGDVFFTVNLPSKANLQIQERILSEYLQRLYSQRIEPITLVGHSAGGVTSRLYVLNPSRKPVNALITIASPHLGTPVASIASLAGNSPIGMMASMAGVGALQASQGLFSDLKEERPYNFLFWMNRQPHPEMLYASIIRINQVDSKTSKLNIAKIDFVVPTQNQNMNNVWALKDRSGVAFSKEGHSLNVNDGKVVVNILEYIKKEM